MATNFNEIEKIVILDLGSHSNQELTRSVRNLGVYSELKTAKTTKAEIEALGNVKGVILSGGMNRVDDAEPILFDPSILELDIPVLTISYATQLMVKSLDGKLGKRVVEVEREMIAEILDDEGLLKGSDKKETVYAEYAHEVAIVPEGFTVTAKTEEGSILAFENESRQIYSIQFHPEDTKTTHGDNILSHFIFDVCQAKGDWSMEQFIDIEVESIRRRVGDRKVLLGLSGGVDSSVVGVLLQKAIGDQLVCIFVDHGLLRKNEANQVMNSLEEFGLNIIKVDAKDRFFSKLKGVSDPEKKRKIIGNEFVYVFDDEANKLEGIDFLAQGTIYSDVIESGLGGKMVKSHHNVGGLPEDMEFELIEPLAALFKDEVRTLGTTLGMPDEIVWRQPFPGPGLGVRVIGEITDEKVEIVREADAIFREEIAKAGMDRDIWQYFAVIPGFKSVGVREGNRSFDYTIALRAIHSEAAMTSEVARIPYDVLEKVVTRITNEVPHVNRVVYDVTPKPPATIEWE